MSKRYVPQHFVLDKSKEVIFYLGKREVLRQGTRSMDERFSF